MLGVRSPKLPEKVTVKVQGSEAAYAVVIAAEKRDVLHEQKVLAAVAVQVAQLTEAEPEWTLDDLLSRCRVPGSVTVPAAATPPPSA
jgi:hypothetical protein